MSERSYHGATSRSPHVGRHITSEKSRERKIVVTTFVVDFTTFIVDYNICGRYITTFVVVATFVGTTSVVKPCLVILAISRSSQCPTTGVTKAVVCVILSVGEMHIKEPLLLIGKSSLCGGSGFPLSLYLSGSLPYV